MPDIPQYFDNQPISTETPNPLMPEGLAADISAPNAILARDISQMQSGLQEFQNRYQENKDMVDAVSARNAVSAQAINLNKNFEDTLTRGTDADGNPIDYDKVYNDYKNQYDNIMGNINNSDFNNRVKTHVLQFADTRRQEDLFNAGKTIAKYKFADLVDQAQQNVENAIANRDYGTAWSAITGGHAGKIFSFSQRKFYENKIFQTELQNHVNDLAQGHGVQWAYDYITNPKNKESLLTLTDDSGLSHRIPDTYLDEIAGDFHTKLILQKQEAKQAHEDYFQGVEKNIWDGLESGAITSNNIDDIRQQIRNTKNLTGNEAFELTDKMERYIQNKDPFIKTTNPALAVDLRRRALEGDPSLTNRMVENYHGAGIGKNDADEIMGIITSKNNKGIDSDNELKRLALKNLSQRFQAAIKEDGIDPKAAAQGEYAATLALEKYLKDNSGKKSFQQLLTPEYTVNGQQINPDYKLDDIVNQFIPQATDEWGLNGTDKKKTQQTQSWLDTAKEILGNVGSAISGVPSYNDFAKEASIANAINQKNKDEQSKKGYIPSGTGNAEGNKGDEPPSPNTPKGGTAPSEPPLNPEAQDNVPEPSQDKYPLKWSPGWNLNIGEKEAHGGEVIPGEKPQKVGLRSNETMPWDHPNREAFFNAVTNPGQFLAEVGKDLENPTELNHRVMAGLDAAWGFGSQMAAMAPGIIGSIMGGPRPQQPPLTQLSPDDEKSFMAWYSKRAANTGTDPNPDNPYHFYDLRGAWKAYMEQTGHPPPDKGHLPDDWKLPGHPYFSKQSIYWQPGMPFIDWSQYKKGEDVPPLDWQPSVFKKIAQAITHSPKPELAQQTEGVMGIPFKVFNWAEENISKFAVHHPEILTNVGFMMPPLQGLMNTLNTPERREWAAKSSFGALMLGLPFLSKIFGKEITPADIPEIVNEASNDPKLSDTLGLTQLNNGYFPESKIIGRENISNQLNPVETKVPLQQRLEEPIPPVLEGKTFNKYEGDIRPQSVGAAAFDFKSQKSDLDELTEVLRNIPETKIPYNERTSFGEQFLEAKNGVKDNLAGLKSWTAQALADYKSMPEFTNWDKFVTELTGSITKANYEGYLFGKGMTKRFSPLAMRAMSLYNEAGGNIDELKSQLKITEQNPKTANYAKDYQKAINLTEDEKNFANNGDSYFEAKLAKAMEYGLLNHGLENFITHLFKTGSPAGKELMANLNAGLLNKDPYFTKKRIYESIFKAQQAGEITRHNIAEAIATYDKAFNEAIATREGMKDLTISKADDGREIIKLCKPGPKPENMEGYILPNHPTFRNWQVPGLKEGPQGIPGMVNADAWVHPDYVKKFENLLSNSELQKMSWSKWLLSTSSNVKALKLTASVFHQVQVGIHGVLHGVNPFNPGKIDLTNPTLNEIINHGLILMDYSIQHLFSEGLASNKWIEKTPIMGGFLRQYSDYLFKDYIPRLKCDMALKAFGRNLRRFSETNPDGTPKFSRDQILSLTADQANAAFGENNYRKLGISRTWQDVARMITFSPDFTLARTLFATQAVKPYGRGIMGIIDNEQALAAIWRGFVGVYIAARVGNMALNNGDPKWDKPLTLQIGNRDFSFRSVAGDVLHLIQDPQSFFYYRLNPLTTRTILEGLTGRDAQGKIVDGTDQLTDLLKTMVPIALSKEGGGMGWGPSVASALGLSETRSRTAFEKNISKAYNDKFTISLKRPERLKNELINRYAIEFHEAGTPEDKQKIIENAKEDLANGALTRHDFKTLKERATHDPNLHLLNSIDIEDFIKNFPKATDEEKAKYGKVLRHRLNNLRASDIDKYRSLKPLLEENLGR